MDGKLVSGSLSAHTGGEPNGSPPFVTYTEQFYEVFPYYLSIGMTYEQFWEGDPSLTKYYRKADEMRTEKMNMEKWLQGMYIYEALCDVSPVLNAFAKKGTKPHPYVDKPYPITNKQRAENAKATEKAVFNKGKKFMEGFMAQNNKRFGKGTPQTSGNGR